MKTLLFLAIIPASLSLLLTGCVSGKAEVERVIAAMDQEDSREHEALMRTFVAKAQADDIDGMIALSSKLTIRQIGGKEKLRTFYRTDTIPVLKFFRAIAPGGASTFGADNDGHFGWKFKRTFISADRKPAQLQFTILREDGALVVAYYGPWERG